MVASTPVGERFGSQVVPAAGSLAGEADSPLVGEVGRLEVVDSSPAVAGIVEVEQRLLDFLIMVVAVRS